MKKLTAYLMAGVLSLPMVGSLAKSEGYVLVDSNAKHVSATFEQTTSLTAIQDLLQQTMPSDEHDYSLYPENRDRLVRILKMLQQAEVSGDYSLFPRNNSR